MSRGSAQRSAARHSLRGTASASIASPQMRRGVEASCSGDDRHRVAHDQLRHAAPRTISYAVQRKNVRHHGVRTCASCDERVGTSAASAGRVSDGGAAHGSGTASRWAAARREIPSGRGVDGSARMRMVKRPQKVPGRSDQEPKSRETPTPLRAYTSGSSPLRAGTNPIQHFFIAHGGERPTRSMLPSQTRTQSTFPAWIRTHHRSRRTALQPLRKVRRS